MPRKAVRCVVELILHAVSAPGCWLPSKEETYLSVSLFSQFKNTKLLTSSFPILIDESFRFEKTYFTALDVEEVIEILEDELVVLELLQLSEYSDGAIHLATYTNNVRDFLYPYEKYKPSVHSRDREIFLERTVAFPGISPKLEFSSKVLIKESYSDELDALEDAFDFHKTTIKDNRRSKRQPRSCSPRRNGSPSATLAERIEDINLYAYSDNRPPFVVRKLDEDLIGRQPGGLLVEQNAKSKPHKCIKLNQARSKIATVSFDGYNNLDAYANIKTNYLNAKTTRSLRSSPVPRYDYSCQYLDDDLDDDSEVAGITSRVRDYYVPSYRTRSASTDCRKHSLSPRAHRVTSPGLETRNSRRDLYISPQLRSSTSPRPSRNTSLRLSRDTSPSIRYGTDTSYERSVSRNNYLDDNRKLSRTCGKKKYPEIADDYSAAINGLDDHGLHIHINGNEPSKDLDIKNYDRKDDENKFAKRGDDFNSFSGTNGNDRNVNGVRFDREFDRDNMRIGRMDDYAIYGKRDEDLDPYSRLSDNETDQGLNQFDRKTGFGRNSQQSYEYICGMGTGRDNTFDRMSGRTRIEHARADDIEDYSTRSGTGKYRIPNGGPDIGYDEIDSNHISLINTRNDTNDDKLDKYSPEVGHDGFDRNLDFDDEGNLYSKPGRYRKRTTDSNCQLADDEDLEACYNLASSMDNPDITTRVDAYWNQVLLKGTDGGPLPSRPVSPVLNKSRFRDRFSESPFFSTSNKLSERVSHVLSRNKLVLNSLNFSNSSCLSSEVVN